jgi:hypothetical protein
MASGDVSIIISFATRYEIIDPRTGGSLGPRSTFVAGLDDGPALVDSTGGGMAMQVDFTPIGAHRVLKVPMHLLAHGTTELSELLGSQADRLVERLFEARDWQTRFWILDEYLLPKVSRSKAAAECGYSDQAHMIREFFALSGATPAELLKRYSSEGGIVEF